MESPLRCFFGLIMRKLNAAEQETETQIQSSPLPKKRVVANLFYFPFHAKL